MRLRARVAAITVMILKFFIRVLTRQNQTRAVQMKKLRGLHKNCAYWLLLRERLVLISHISSINRAASTKKVEPANPSASARVAVPVNIHGRAEMRMARCERWP